jgi:hypothetical protein
MERCIIQNNIGVTYLEYGEDREAHTTLKETLAAIKSVVLSIRNPSVGSAKAAATSFVPLPTNETKIHSLVRVSHFTDSHFFLCDHAFFIHTETFQDLRPTWTDERLGLPFASPEAVQAHQELMDHPTFIVISSAIVIFNTALLYHRQGLQEGPSNSQESNLNDAMKLYYLVRSLLAECEGCNAFRVTKLAILMAVANNLIQIHHRFGQEKESHKMLQEAVLLFSSSDSIQAQVDPSITLCLMLNLGSQARSAAAA